VSRWLTQTRAGGPDAPLEERGDCLDACCASILGVPIGTVPCRHGERWWDHLHDALRPHGYCIGVLDMKLSPPRGYWIASVPSLNLVPTEGGRPVLHVVVACGDEFVHDPSKGKRYDDASWLQAWDDGAIVEGWVLVPLDPGERAA
jgi:hypothetical protein